MCNAYTVRPKLGAREIDALVSEEIQKLPSALVRRTGQGVVLTSQENQFSVKQMRWGFSRPFSDAINNARSDKFHSPTWQDALRSRRCLVPISTFYEWQERPNGSKQAFEFKRPDLEWMWVAGLYEKSEKYCSCYATITTEPARVVLPIHDRMLAVMDWERALDFLLGNPLTFAPYEGPLIAEACASPLKQTKKPPDGSSQGSLF